jgi:hypothetical protein
MAEQVINGIVRFPFIPNVIASRNPTYLIETLDAADEKFAYIIQAPKTGNISKVGWRTSTVATGATFDIRLETVSTTDGNPTGTLLDTNTNGSQVVGDTDDNTWFTTSLTSNAAVTKGDIIAIVIASPGAGGHDIDISKMDTAAAYRYHTFPYEDLFTAAWVKDESSGTFALEYDDGSYAPIPNQFPQATNGNLSVTTATSPDEIGLKFKFTVPVRIIGFSVWCDLNIGAGTSFILYDSDGSTALQTFVVDPDQLSANTNTTKMYLFSGSESLSKDTFYRLTMRPDTTTLNTIAQYTVDSVAVMDSFDGGQDFHKTERTDAGAWTDTTTARPHIGLILDAFDDGVSIGGGSGWFSGE